jgi:hypothetical protein
MVIKMVKDAEVRGGTVGGRLEKGRSVCPC